MRIKLFKYFESRFPDQEMIDTVEDILIHLRDDGFSIDVDQLTKGGIEIHIWNGYKEDDGLLNSRYKEFKYSDTRDELRELFSHIIQNEYIIVGLIIKSPTKYVSTQTMDREDDMTIVRTSDYEIKLASIIQYGEDLDPDDIMKFLDHRILITSNGILSEIEIRIEKQNLFLIEPFGTVSSGDSPRN